MRTVAIVTAILAVLIVVATISADVILRRRAWEAILPPVWVMGRPGYLHVVTTQSIDGSVGSRVRGKVNPIIEQPPGDSTWAYTRGQSADCWPHETMRIWCWYAPTRSGFEFFTVRTGSGDHLADVAVAVDEWGYGRGIFCREGDGDYIATWRDCEFIWREPTNEPVRWTE
jgi:hypothetical protein